jgi:hypothetical protein
VNWRAIFSGPSGTGDGLAPLQRDLGPGGTSDNHPMRRRTFDQLHGLRQRHGRGQRQQNMNVILRAARDESFESVLAGDAADEGPKIRLNLSRNQIPAILRREYAMDKTTNVGVRHGESVEQPADREEK